MLAGASNLSQIKYYPMKRRGKSCISAIRDSISATKLNLQKPNVKHEVSCYNIISRKLIKSEAQYIKTKWRLLIDEYIGSESCIAVNDSGGMSGGNTELSSDEFLRGNPYRPLSGNEILTEIAQSRACYEAGEEEDFDKVLDEIGKIYIWNDGGMPSELNSTEKLFEKHSSKQYNPKLANVFFKSGMIEAWGRGFDKIKEACVKYDGRLPEYNISVSGIMVLCKACDKYLELLNDESYPVQNEQDDEQDIIIKKLRHVATF